MFHIDYVFWFHRYYTVFRLGLISVYFIDSQAVLKVKTSVAAVQVVSLPTEVFCIQLLPTVSSLVTKEHDLHTPFTGKLNQLLAS